MRVAHVISGDLWAGAEVMAFNLLRELSAYSDAEVSVYLLNGGTLADKLSGLPVTLKVDPESKRSFLQLLSSTRQWLKHLQPHIIHSHRYKENILAYLASRECHRVRLMTTQHGLPEVRSGRLVSKERLVAGLNQMLLRKRFDRVVAVSANIGKYFRLDGTFPAERLAVVHNGIALPSTSCAYAQREQLVVGSAGRLFPVKDYPLMVEIARCVGFVAPATRFVLAGDGPEKSALLGQVHEHGLDAAFTLLGHVDDISAFYGNLDLYINTSVHEGIPMSILEAMAHGLPVVAPNVGGIGEIINDGVDGFLVNDRRPESFARPILQLQDAAVRRRIGEAAREKIRASFSAQSMASQYHQLYRNLLS